MAWSFITGIYPPFVAGDPVGVDIPAYVADAKEELTDSIDFMWPQVTDLPTPELQRIARIQLLGFADTVGRIVEPYTLFSYRRISHTEDMMVEFAQWMEESLEG